MRALKRWLAYCRGEWKIRKRRAQIKKQLCEFFSSPVRLSSKGRRGHDSIYLVRGGDKLLGVMRLQNPFKSRANPPVNMPFVSLQGNARIDYEWDFYTRLQDSGLVPAPLWRCQDALICEYLPLKPVDEYLHAQPHKAWDYICAVTRELARLHQQGVTHMDASLANTLANDTLSQLVFIDFEYAPAPGLSVQQQQVYDYLRVLESCWKFLPQQVQEDYTQWLSCLRSVLTEENSVIDLSPLWPALGRLYGHESLRKQLIALFSAA